jgi:hypothetical protein
MPETQYDFSKLTDEEMQKIFAAANATYGHYLMVDFTLKQALLAINLTVAILARNHAKGWEIDAIELAILGLKGLKKEAGKDANFWTGPKWKEPGNGVR